VNRETKRLLQRQGRPESMPARTAEFLREVRNELRRVAWPTRQETLNSSVVVLIALVVLTSAIFGMDTVFSKFMLFLFKQ
jgi:preprotein translocase subunit SecE